MREKIFLIAQKLLLFLMISFMLTSLLCLMFVDMFTNFFNDQGYREYKAHFHTFKQFIEDFGFKVKAICFFSIPYTICGMIGLLTNRVGFLVIHLTFCIASVILSVLLICCCSLRLIWLVEDDDGTNDMRQEDQDWLMLIILLGIVLGIFMSLKVLLNVKILRKMDGKKVIDSESASLAESRESSEYETERKSHEAYV